MREAERRAGRTARRGKITAVAPAPLSEPWCAGQVLLLSPRRLAGRYLKHPCPDDPATANAALRARRAVDRDRAGD